MRVLLQNERLAEPEGPIWCRLVFLQSCVPVYVCVPGCQPRDAYLEQEAGLLGSSCSYVWAVAVRPRNPAPFLREAEAQAQAQFSYLRVDSVQRRKAGLRRCGRDILG